MSHTRLVVHFVAAFGRFVHRTMGNGIPFRDDVHFDFNVCFASIVSFVRLFVVCLFACLFFCFVRSFVLGANINICSVHKAFDEATEKAAARGIRVTGSEIVGLIPKKVLIEAAHHYLTKQQRSHGIADDEKIKIAVKSLGLDDLVILLAPPNKTYLSANPDAAGIPPSPIGVPGMVESLSSSISTPDVSLNQLSLLVVYVIRSVS